MKESHKNIVKAFMQFPKMSDRKIADIAGVSQPTVTRIRHRLVDGGFLSFLAVPGLSKLGYEIVAMNTVKCSTAKDHTALKDKRVVFVCMHAEIQRETAFVVSVHKDYSSYIRLISKFREPCKIILLETSKLTKPIKPFSFKDICM